jgi:hypothetical protein
MMWSDIIFLQGWLVIHFPLDLASGLAVPDAQGLSELATLIPHP